MALDFTDERHLLRTIELQHRLGRPGPSVRLPDRRRAGETPIQAENIVVTWRDVTVTPSSTPCALRASSSVRHPQGRNAVHEHRAVCHVCGRDLLVGHHAGRLRARERDVGGNRGGVSGGFDLAAPVPGGLRTGWAPVEASGPHLSNRQPPCTQASGLARAAQHSACGFVTRSVALGTSRAGRRPDGPPREVAATVRAARAEDALRAVGAERALERADPREVALGRQVTVAALAIGRSSSTRRDLSRQASSAGAGCRGTAGPDQMLEHRALRELQAVRRCVCAHEGQRRPRRRRRRNRWRCVAHRGWPGRR